MRILRRNTVQSCPAYHKEEGCQDLRTRCHLGERRIRHDAAVTDGRLRDEREVHGIEELYTGGLYIVAGHTYGSMCTLDVTITICVRVAAHNGKMRHGKDEHTGEHFGE